MAQAAFARLMSASVRRAVCIDEDLQALRELPADIIIHYSAKARIDRGVVRTSRSIERQTAQTPIKSTLTPFSPFFSPFSHVFADPLRSTSLVMGHCDPAGMIRSRFTVPIRACGHRPQKQAGHMTASGHNPSGKFTLASRGPSTHDREVDRWLTIKRSLLDLIHWPPKQIQFVIES